MDPLSQALYLIRAKAQEFRESFGDEQRARALEWAAEHVEKAVSSERNTPLRLDEAARASGYSRDHLARMIREGRLVNAGRPHAPRIRRGNLPFKVENVAVVTDVTHIGDASATQVARSLIQRGRP